MIFDPSPLIRAPRFAIKFSFPVGDSFALLGSLQVGFGMDMDIISGKNTEFTEAIALALVGIHVAIFEQPFHKVMTSVAFTLFLMAVGRMLPVHECKCSNLIG